MKSKALACVIFILATTGAAFSAQSTPTTQRALQARPSPVNPGPFQLTTNTRCVAGSPEIVLSWSASSGAARYDVYRNGQLLYNVLQSQTFRNEKVTPGASYSYFVKASSASGGTQTSNTVTAVAPTCVASTTPARSPSTVSPSQTSGTSGNTGQPQTSQPTPAQIRPYTKEDALFNLKIWLYLDFCNSNQAFGLRELRAAGGAAATDPVTAYAGLVKLIVQNLMPFSIASQINLELQPYQKRTVSEIDSRKREIQQKLGTSDPVIAYQKSWCAK